MSKQTVKRHAVVPWSLPSAVANHCLPSLVSSVLLLPPLPTGSSGLKVNAWTMSIDPTVRERPTPANAPIPSWSILC